jgi:glycosyltransferase involved in cell wall biosynthesis
MKIAVFYNLAFGGAKRVVQYHVKELAALGHQVDIYTTDQEIDSMDPGIYAKRTFRYSFSLEQKTLPVIGRILTDYHNFVTLANLHKEIANDIDKRKYDVVLCHPDKFTQAPFLLRYLHTPNAYYCQEPLRIVYEYAMRFKDKTSVFNKAYEAVTRDYRKKIDRENVRSSTQCIASCFHIRERMIEAYEVYPKVVYCAVDEKVFRPVKVIKKNQVFYIGSPKEVTDGYDLAKQAIELLPKKNRPVLHVISWKKENGERLTDEELVEIYNQSIVTLCTSRFETFGLVPLESMACGVPVIATNVSGHRETVVTDKTGFLVEFSPEQIAAKIKMFSANKELQSNMGNAGREWVKKEFIWKIQAKKLETVLQEIVR